jgi:phosphoglycerol transferase MdoB-like AlkP superfamily enzyme
VYTFQLKQRDWSKVLSAFHILIGLILVYDLTHVTEEGKKDWIFSTVYVIAALFLVLAGIFNRKLIPSLSKHLNLLLFQSFLVISGAIYFWSKGASLVAVSHAILAGAIVLFWIYLKKREDGEKIVVSERNIILPGLSADRLIEWNQLSNVIKKHDLLTIDFKNNKLLQVQVINADHIDEDEFNEFCQQQLAVE